jgi:hypothetical protein
MGTASKLFITGLVAVVPACGPSLATIHEGTIRFEHCYRVDLEPRVAPSYRLACWGSWISAYTVGQPRDRIEYAERRYRSLQDGDASAPELALEPDAGTAPRQFYLAVPAPTNPHAPPPPLAKPLVPTDAAAGSDAGGPNNEVQAKNEPEKPPPSATCTKVCQSSWGTCDASCQTPGAASCTKCKSAYSKCMRGCFE